VPLIDDTPEAACEVLKQHMAKVVGLPGGKPFPRWFCDGPLVPGNRLVYIFGLRTAPEATELPHSPLVGWFAVARKTSLVFEYDIDEERLIPISQAYYKRPSAVSKNRPAVPQGSSPR